MTSERLGAWSLPSVLPEKRFWVHAASVGETRIAILIARMLLEEMPRAGVVLSATTVGGRALGRAGGFPSFLLPLDLPFCVSPVLARLRPRALIVVETELWPVLLARAQRAGAAVALVNGRISAKSWPRYRLIRPFLRRTLSRFSALGMRTAEDRDRIIALGAPAERTIVTGDLKMELEPDVLHRAEARRRFRLSEEDLVLTAGSTREGEEPLVLGALAKARQGKPSGTLRCLIAPRHLRRVGDALAAASAAGLTAATLSDVEAGLADAPIVIVLDRLGELPAAYAAGDVAFVGGTLVPVGGHNPYEPALLGRPVLVGPHTEGISEAVAGLLQTRGAIQVRDAADLTVRLSKLLGNLAHRVEMGRRARGAVDLRRGALAKTLDLLTPILGR